MPKRWTRSTGYRRWHADVLRNLTFANQLTILRIVLIPAFVLLVVYGRLGAALLVFVTAGATDALDGLIARRAGQRTSLGAWLDPMADKLLLVTTFIVLTLPGITLTNHLPLWLTVVVISRDVVILAVVAIVNLAIGPRTFRPSLLGKATTAAFIAHQRRHHVLQLPAGDVAAGRCRDLAVAGVDARLGRRLLLPASSAD